MRYYILKKLRGLPLGNVVEYATSSLLCQGLRFLGVLLTTYYLSPEQFGHYATILIVLTFSGIVLSPGHNEAFIAYDGDDIRYTHFHFQIALLTSVLASLGIAIWIYCMGSALFKSIGVVLIGSVFLESLTQTPHYLAQKRNQFRWTGLVDVLGVFTSILCLYYFCRTRPTVESLIYAKIGEAAIRFILHFFRFGRSIIGFCFDREVWRYYWSPFMESALPRAWIDSLMGRIDMIILSGAVPLYQLGLYERIQHFVQIPLSLGANLIDRVSLMTYSKYQNQWSQLHSALKSSLWVSLFFSTFSVLGITLLFEPMMSRIVGPAKSIELYALWTHSIGFIFLKPILVTFSLYFHGTGRAYAILFQHLLSLILVVLIGYPFVISFGLYGMSYALTVTYLILISVQIYSIFKLKIPSSAHE